MEAVLAAAGDGPGEAGAGRGVLRLVPSPDAGGKSLAPDPELKELLEDIRRRQHTRRGSERRRPEGGDAA